MLNETNVPLNKEEIVLIVETIFAHATLVDKLNDCGMLTPTEHKAAYDVMNKQLAIVAKLKAAADVIDRQREMMMRI